MWVEACQEEVDKQFYNDLHCAGVSAQVLTTGGQAGYSPNTSKQLPCWVGCVSLPSMVNKKRTRYVLSIWYNRHISRIYKCRGNKYFINVELPLNFPVVIYVYKSCTLSSGLKYSNFWRQVTGDPRPQRSVCLVCWRPMKLLMA